MTVRQLNRDQLTELKLMMVSDEIFERKGRTPSYGELAEAEAEAESVPDEKVFEKYEGTKFSSDDFYCTTGK